MRARARPFPDNAPLDRAALWRYCRRAAYQAKHRAKALNVPYDIDGHYVDELLVRQSFRCAVSGIALEAAKGSFRGTPLGPSLDRIVPARGYTRGNLRVVCHAVNLAMNEWGLEILQRLAIAITEEMKRDNHVKVMQARLARQHERAQNRNNGKSHIRSKTVAEMQAVSTR